MSSHIHHKTIDLLLTKYLKATISYEGIQRVETFPVARNALRESVLNAIIHRDYAIGAPIQIRVYGDRLQIWNPGHLPEDWSRDKLLHPHASRRFNPEVANAFFRAGETEAWGRGIQRVFQACREAGMPEPQLQGEPGEFTFGFQFSGEYLGSLATGADAEPVEKTTQKTTQERILDVLREDATASRRAIAERLEDITEDGVKYHLNRLKDAGLIRRVGPDRGGRWVVSGGNEE